jgi:hypothetical protein
LPGRRYLSSVAKANLCTCRLRWGLPSGAFQLSREKLKIYF